MMKNARILLFIIVAISLSSCGVENNVESGILDSALNAKSSKKYQPKNRDELVKLLRNEKIYLGDIDTSKITDMSFLFAKIKPQHCYVNNCKNNAKNRSDFSGIELWDTSNVRNMEAMFYYNSNFNHNIESWNVSNVRDMGRMFSVAWAFNQPLDSWDISNADDLTIMFAETLSFNQNLDSWKPKSGVNMLQMFRDSGIQKLPKWYEKPLWE